MALTDQQLIDTGVRTGLIDPAILEQLRITARRQRLPLINMILAKFHFPRTTLYRAVAEDRNIKFINLYPLQVAMDILKTIPITLVRRKQILPVLIEGAATLVISDPNDRSSIDSIFRLIGQSLPLVMADLQALQYKIEQISSDAPSTPVTTSETDLIDLLDTILKEAYLNRASDIHLLIEATGLRIRLRIDGRLADYPVIANTTTAASLISRVKVLSGLDIAETRQPQDGGFSHYIPAPFDLEFNIRVATVPTRLGERITMRLLGQQTDGLTLTDLGMLDEDLQRFNQAIRNPYGMILLTGPTGSGKSTTLFAALQEINNSEINIMTVENPIEYVMDGVSQIQTGPKINFADALRSLLRHDPDVLMVGEIRDHETADVAVKSAMTGHMVFSTLHTNNAISAVTRLIDIGCEPFLIGSTMTAVIAQRLVRRLCSQCRKRRPATIDEISALEIEDDIELYDPVGCATCQGTGYKGRLGLFETLWFDEKLSRLIAKGCEEEEIEAQAGTSLQFMWEDGCRKVLSGMTTLAEVRDVAIPKSHDKNKVN